MRDLAAASGMSLAGIYYYVRGKEDLLAHIQERCFSQVLEGAETALASAVAPPDRALSSLFARSACCSASFTMPGLPSLVVTEVAESTHILTR